MQGKKAKVFWTGRSQAVRLPKELRVAGETVLVLVSNDEREFRRVPGLRTDNWFE